jgi:hypothetical protein
VESHAGSRQAKAGFVRVLVFRCRDNTNPNQHEGNMKIAYATPLLLLGLSALAPKALAVPVQWGTNGHWYERVSTQTAGLGGITWDDARAAAAAAGGYLATVTSAEENLFLSTTEGLGWEQDQWGTKFDNLLHYHWIGCAQVPPGEETPGKGWTWVTGEAFAYVNWADGEPNDSPDPEWAIVFDHGFSSDGKCWNDLNGTWPVDGYIVEWDQLPPATVPDSASSLVLTLGALGLVIAIKRKLN